MEMSHSLWKMTVRVPGERLGEREEFANLLCVSKNRSPRDTWKYTELMGHFSYFEGQGKRGTRLRG